MSLLGLNFGVPHDFIFELALVHIFYLYRYGIIYVASVHSSILKIRWKVHQRNEKRVNELSQRFHKSNQLFEDGKLEAIKVQ